MRVRSPYKEKRISQIKRKIDKIFEKKDKMVLTNLYLALDDSVLFNMKTETTAKGI